jgi:N-methylhydantoinase B/oxoprolinase/acetone carboxylase alpha subunit
VVPAELQILISRLTGVAEEMGAVLRGAAFSPNTKERADCSAALFTADGELLVPAEHIPGHLGSMPASVAAAIDAFGDGRPPLRPGDQVVLNDPFRRRHPPRRRHLVAPCFLDGRLAGGAANRAHHADLGGMAPGSIPPDATEIYQEAPADTAGAADPAAVEDILCANSRTPEERPGDLDAQREANMVGVGRLAALAATGAPCDEVTAYGERRMRAALADVPDGRWTFDDVIDSRGPSPDQQRPARIEATLASKARTPSFDFTGTDAQRRGDVSAVEAVTGSAVALALHSATDPTIPGQRRGDAPGHGHRPCGRAGGRPAGCRGGRRQRHRAPVR